MRTLLLVLALGCAETDGGGGGAADVECEAATTCEDGRFYELCEGPVRRWLQVGDERFYCEVLDCSDVACDAEHECFPSIDQCFGGRE
jgi:hypothetical protein